MFLSQLYSKKIFCFSIAFFLILLAVLVFGLITRKAVPPSHEKKSDSVYDQFLAEDVFIDLWRGERLFCSITAEQILHRDRTSRLFRYHNLKEIYFSNLRFEYHQDEKDLQSGKSIPDIIGNIIIKDVIDSFVQGEGYSQATQKFSTNNTVSKPNYKILTKIQIDHLLISIHRDNGSSVKIFSDHASVYLQSRNIEFT